jgi:hypothetical protein
MLKPFSAASMEIFSLLLPEREERTFSAVRGSVSLIFLEYTSEGESETFLTVIRSERNISDMTVSEGYKISFL